MNDVERVEKTLSEISGGTVVVGTHRRDRPDLIFYKKGSGFYALEIRNDDESTVDCGKRLAEKNRQLRIAFPELASSTIEQVIVDFEDCKAHTIGAATRVISQRELSNLITEFIGKNESLTDEIATSILTRLQPAMTFQASVRIPSEDKGAHDRALMRLALDDTQAKFASLEGKDVLKIVGPPGSGKTLVLIARAKLFATAHPDWTIQFVAYNKSLAGYLENQFYDFENISVSTFYKFSEARGHKTFTTDDDEEEKYFNYMARNVQPNVDALFIDEYQDFRESWMRYCLATLRPNRGGATIAGDHKQGIYRLRPPDDAFLGRPTETFFLDRPYRSTRQILEVASRIDPEFETTGISQAPNGQSVNLVYAESADVQAQYIAWEISKMIKEGLRKPADIAVLGAFWPAVLRMQDHLDRKGVKYAVVGGRGVDAPEWGKVTLTTLHSAKGYEFDVVFLMAVESLPAKDDRPDAVVQRRGAYVGPTRARDELFITYTRRNDIIDKLHDAPENLISPWTWPDDFKDSE